jgi:2,5-diketo-D-gluconate reductase A
MPLLGFGTWQMRGGECRRAVQHALDVGYRHLDTATMYRNEDDIGRAIRESGVAREELFITTKLVPNDAGRERRTLEASLRALGTEYVDLWLIHWPPGRAGIQTWKEFLALRDEGKTRAVGVSNYHIEQIDELTQTSGQTPQVNQIRWGPSLYDADEVAEHGAVTWSSRATARSRRRTCATRCWPRSPNATE